MTISGNTTFPGTVSGPTPTLDSHLATKGYVDSRAIKKLSDTSLPTSGTTTILSQEEADKYVVYLGYADCDNNNSIIAANDTNNNGVLLLQNSSNNTRNIAFMMINDIDNNISTSFYLNYYSSMSHYGSGYRSSCGAKFSGKIRTSNATSAKIVLYAFTS